MFSAAWALIDLAAITLVALSADTYITITSSIVIPILTTFGVLFWQGIRRYRQEKRAEPVAVRTVAIDEMESLARMLRETIKQKDHDYTECLQRLESCQSWRMDHVKICPLFGARRDTRT